MHARFVQTLDTPMLAHNARDPRDGAPVSIASPPSPAAAARMDRLERLWVGRPGILGWLTTTDHKKIALLYFWTTLVLFGAGGVEALLMRTQLASANASVVSSSTY